MSMRVIWTVPEERDYPTRCRNAGLILIGYCKIYLMNCTIVLCRQEFCFDSEI